MITALFAGIAAADTTVFFDPSQLATVDGSGVTSDVIESSGHRFTVTRDKLFTGGVGMTEPIGRAVRVAWPEGVEAQAVTAGPSPGGARIVLERVDGTPFDLTAFTARLLANTAGAGGSIEIMPSLGGEDGFPDPIAFDASGIGGNSFSYDTSADPLGSTALLVGFDRYEIALYVDFALTALTLEGAPVPEPTARDAELCAGVSILCLCVARRWPSSGPLRARRRRGDLR